MKSKKKLFEAFKELKKWGIEGEYWSNETYGKKSMIYIKWLVSAMKSQAEEHLKEMGFDVQRGYEMPRTSEIQVSYFKGRHWDE